MENKANLANVAFLKDREIKSKDLINKRHRRPEDERLARMDSLEFLMMAGGGIMLGVGIYLLSFLTV
ncbi:MAG TPA: hypothetical protein VF199_00920 [Bacillales bacterium]